jgi:uncharacterized protein (TIGR03118 family)
MPTGPKGPETLSRLESFNMNKVYIGALFATMVVQLAFSAGGANSYVQTNLVANSPGTGNHTDSQLSNSWGISFTSGSAFWIADNNSGLSTLYDAQGNKQSLVVSIATASVNPCTPGCPTGTVGNSTGDFRGNSFIFDTEDGIIAAWNGGSTATSVFDNSASGAVYKGLAIATNSSRNFLPAANFNSGRIDVFDRNVWTRRAGQHKPAGRDTSHRRN